MTCLAKRATSLACCLGTTMTPSPSAMTTSPGMTSTPPISTGRLTDSLKVGSGAVIAADEKLYYDNQRGELKLLSYSEGKMEEISSFKIEKGTKEHFSHPVIYRGVLYQRRGNMLMAYNIRMPG